MKIIILSIMLLLPVSATAQVQLAAFTLGSAIDYTGEPFHVQATLGQAAAGTLPAPPYAVEAGFWLVFASDDQVTPIEHTDTALPRDLRLEGNYPNPFNPQTTIRYVLPQATEVRLAVYDALGREVAVLAEGTRSAGTHEIVFQAGDLPSGAYFYRLEAKSTTRMGTMLLLK